MSAAPFSLNACIDSCSLDVTSHLFLGDLIQTHPPALRFTLHQLTRNNKHPSALSWCGRQREVFAWKNVHSKWDGGGKSNQLIKPESMAGRLWFWNNWSMRKSFISRESGGSLSPPPISATRWLHRSFHPCEQTDFITITKGLRRLKNAISSNLFISGINHMLNICATPVICYPGLMSELRSELIPFTRLAHRKGSGPKRTIIRVETDLIHFFLNISGFDAFGLWTKLPILVSYEMSIFHHFQTFRRRNNDAETKTQIGQYSSFPQAHVSKD